MVFVLCRNYSTSFSMIILLQTMNFGWLLFYEKDLRSLKVFPCIYPPRIKWLKKIVLKLLERNYMNIIFSSKKRTENMTDSMKIIQEHLRLAVLNVNYNLKYKAVHPIDPLIQWNSVWWSLRLNLDLSVSVLKTGLKQNWDWLIVLNHPSITYALLWSPTVISAVNQ